MDYRNEIDKTVNMDVGVHFVWKVCNLRRDKGNNLVDKEFVDGSNS